MIGQVIRGSCNLLIPAMALRDDPCPEVDEGVIGAGAPDEVSGCPHIPPGAGRHAAGRTAGGIGDVLLVECRQVVGEGLVEPLARPALCSRRSDDPQNMSAFTGRSSHRSMA